MTERLNVDADETVQIDRLAATPNNVRVARVNLLPPAFARERTRRRISAASIMLLVLYVGVLGVVYVFKLDAVSEVRGERDATERELAALRIEADSLREFQVLATQLDTRQGLLAAAMDKEMSWASVLGDLALAFSQQSSLVSVQAVTTGSDAAASGVTTATPAAAPPATAATTTADGELAPGTPVAQITFSGYSVDRFAPGVEDVLAKFDGAEVFVKPYLTTATDEERGGSQVTTFEGRVNLNDKIFTHRYDDGLPEESVQ